MLTIIYDSRDEIEEEKVEKKEEEKKESRMKKSVKMIKKYVCV